MEVLTLNGKQQELYRYVETAGPEGISNESFTDMVRSLELTLEECSAINSINLFEFHRYPNCVRVRVKARRILN